MVMEMVTAELLGRLTELHVKKKAQNRQVLSTIAIVQV